MTVRRLSAVDAQTYWMSAKIPNDTVLLYGFSGGPADPDAALEEIAERARGCPDLTVRIEDGGRLTYPAWVHREVDRSLVRGAQHRGPHLPGLPRRGECPDRRSAGCPGGGVADARVHRHRGRTRRGGPGHGGGTADLARARWWRANLGARRDHVRPARMASYQESTPRTPGPSTCRSLAFVQRGHIASLSKIPRQDGFRRRPICARRCAPMRDLRGRDTCGLWSGGVRTCPVPP